MRQGTQTAERRCAAASDPLSGGSSSRVRRRIAPSRGWAPLRVGELWEYRELLYFLVWRDVKVRYKQTILGALWAVIQPLCLMVVFTLFFGKLAKIPSDGIPYPIFSYAALVPWTFFATGVSQSSFSVVQSADVIRKVFFPRAALPIGAVLASAVDFAIAFGVLLGMMACFGMVPTAHALWIPFLFLLAFLAALGAGLWLSALYVYYRDIRFVIPFIIQAWMFATPIAYPSSLLAEPWRTLFGLNPMAGVVEGFRWALLGTIAAPLGMLALSYAAALAILISGAFFFRQMERFFADAI